MIKTLSITILIESVVIFGYAQGLKKPLISLLVTGFFANLLTQSLLWFSLRVFPFHYLFTLFSMELLITGIEFRLFYFIKNNQLKMSEAILISFSMNLASFMIGWFIAA